MEKDFMKIKKYIYINYHNVGKSQIFIYYKIVLYEYLWKKEIKIGNIQSKIDVNNKNYKLFKRKYVIYDKNGLAKEYGLFDNKLIYEGEYLNGKRNGQGKEYNIIGNIIFEGEYLNLMNSVEFYYN